jgi:hypothetical protein
LKPDHELDAEQEADRKFFADNPERQIYLRPARGWERSEGDDMTVVVEIRPGLRVRAPFLLNPLINWRALNEDEDELREALRSSPMASLIAAALGETP